MATWWLHGRPQSAKLHRERLTLERIRKFQCPPDKAQDFLWDTDAPRLAVRVTRGGAKTFIFEKKLGRTNIRMMIGDVEAWPLNSVWQGKGDDRHEVQRGAREQAARYEGLVNQGIDPRVETRESIAESIAKRVTARQADRPALEVWLAYIEARRPKWGALSLRDHERAVKEGGQPLTRGRRPGRAAKAQDGALRALLSGPLPSLTDDRIRDWAKAQAKERPTHAGLCLRLLGAFVNWCHATPEYRKLIPSDLDVARIARDELPKKKGKKDCLQREQLAPWFAAVRQLDNPTARAYLQALLITGARREELMALRWDGVDFKWNSIRLRDKVEGERTIPLTPYVASLLADLKTRNVRPIRLKVGEAWEPSPWVFASAASKSGRLADPRIAHVRALGVAGIDHLTLHGLRRSFGTLAEWIEVPAGIVAQIMGHAPSATAEKHYRARPLDLLRMWHVRIEEWLLKEGGVEFKAVADGPTQRKAKG